MWTVTKDYKCENDVTGPLLLPNCFPFLDYSVSFMFSEIEFVKVILKLGCKF